MRSADPALLGWVERAVGLDAERVGCVGRVERLAERRARQLGLPSAEAWVRRVLAGDPEEARVVIDQATIGFTFRGRGGTSLTTLADTLAAQGRPVRLWSAGCSTGEEVEGLLDALADRALQGEVVASDVHPGRVQATRERVAGRVPPGLRVTPVVHNLATEGPLPGGFDAILCRNVTMYFSDRALAHVARAFARALRPGGEVLLAPHEALPAPFRARGDGTRWAVRVAATPSRPTLVPQASPWPGAMGPGPAADAPSPWAAVAEGNRALTAHAFEQALAAYGVALDGLPGASEVHTLMGVVHRKQGDRHQAEARLQRALLHDDRFWPAAWLLAGVIEARGATAEAERLRRSALDDVARWSVLDLLRGDGSRRILLPDDANHPLRRTHDAHHGGGS